jgi:uncharacterized protein (UPF0335 family)
MMAKGNDVGGIAAGQLKSFVERVERLDEELKSLRGDRLEIIREAVAAGFDRKTLLRVVKLRQQEDAQRAEEESLLDLYLSALGMQTSGAGAPSRRASKKSGDEAGAAAPAE